MTPTDNVVPIGAGRDRADGNGRNGYDKRLRDVEGDIREIKTELKHLASREFIYRAILTGLISGLGLAAAVTVAITRLL